MEKGKFASEEKKFKYRLATPWTKIPLIYPKPKKERGDFKSNSRKYQIQWKMTRFLKKSIYLNIYR